MKKEMYMVGAIFVAIVLWGMFNQINDAKAEGYFKIRTENKLVEKDAYYLVLDGQNIPVDKSVYEDIEEGVTYYLSYTWNSRSTNSGKLLSYQLVE